MGRPTKLTAETSDSILSELSMGVSRRDAVEALGIDYDDFIEWMREGGRAKSGDLYDFSVAVRKTEAALRSRLTKLVVGKILGKVPDGADPDAALAYLKTHDPDNW